MERVAGELRQAGNSRRCLLVMGTVRNVGTTYAAISLAGALVQSANVVLVDLAFNAPNLSVLSSNPNAPGIAELMRGSASFGDIVTRDQHSRLHIVATGMVGNDIVTLASSPMLGTVIEALSHNYDHVVIDAGAAGDVASERLASLAKRVLRRPYRRRSRHAQCADPWRAGCAHRHAGSVLGPHSWVLLGGRILPQLRKDFSINSWNSKLNGPVGQRSLLA